MWCSERANLRLHSQELPAAQMQAAKGKWKLVVIRVRGVGFADWMNGWSQPCSGIFNDSLLSVYPVQVVTGSHDGGRRSDGPEVQALLGRLLVTVEDRSLELWLWGREVIFAINDVSWASVVVGSTFRRTLKNKKGDQRSLSPLTFQMPTLSNP